MADYCGTGSGNFPQPGDPDLNGSIVTAAPAFGGIDVSWTYPGLNPQAVAYTILYRSTNEDPATAVQHRIVQGDYFYDRTTTQTLLTYYYWIRLVSVNGTQGELLGPASAQARPTIEQTIEMLTGQIDSGVLAQDLKDDLSGIVDNRQLIDQETLNRAQYDDALAAAVDELTAFTESTDALIREEMLARAEADSAQVTQINSLAVETEDNFAAVQTEMGAFIEQVNGDLETIGAKFTVVADVNGLIGGFGLYNDGSTVEAGFDVDRFWIGRTNENKRKPFIIENGETFINEAVINKLTFNKLRTADGSLTVTPAVYDELGNLVDPGKLKAQFIDAETLELDYGNIKNVDIREADVQNLVLDYGQLKNIDVTSADIRNLAVTEAKLANASVDTLKIKGQAVTVPASSSGTGSAGGGSFGENIATMSYNHGESATLPVAIIASVSGWAQATSGTGGSFPVPWRFRLVVNGSVRYTSGWIPVTGSVVTGTLNGVALYNMPSGNRSVYVDVEADTEGNPYQSSMSAVIVAIGCKR